MLDGGGFCRSAGSGESAVFPLVSAVIPTRNRPRLVLRSVRSALNQTYSNLEVIVVVDGTDLDTVNTLEALDEHRLRIISLEENVGVAEARNIGACRAKGEWVALLDDDDEWLTEKIARQVDLIENAHPDTNFVACRHQEADTAVSRYLPPRFPRHDENWSEYICCNNSMFLPSSWLIRSDFMRSLPFDRGVSLCEDIFWLLRARASNRIIPEFLEDVLVVFHNDNDPTKRLSRNPNWEIVYRWVVTNRKGLLTPKAFTYFLVHFCLPRAKLSRTPLRDSLRVLSTAVSMGKCDLRLCALAAAHVCLTTRMRKRLRDFYETVMYRLKQPTNGAHCRPVSDLDSDL
jgi:glycosyltransferase involved in cell wall biosynthesis